MQIAISNIPNIQDYMQYIQLEPIGSDATLVIVYKTLFRSDDVLVDIYLNEIADNTKIISSRRLTPDSIVSLPRPTIGFNYWINCVDQDGMNTSINKYNAHKFYLQFTSYEGGEWTLEDIDNT